MQTYAIDNRNSFNGLARWLEDVKNYAKKEVIVAVIGNKCDLDNERAIRKE
jgi:GTPase SAR1 family protein